MDRKYTWYLFRRVYPNYKDIFYMLNYMSIQLCKPHNQVLRYSIENSQDKMRNIRH